MTTPHPLDEAALRRPEWREGVPIRLWDGQEWSFRLPVLSDLYPALDRDGNPQLRRGFDLGPSYDVLFNRYVECTDPASELALLAALAFRLLEPNYTLAFGDLMVLLRIKTGDDPEFDANREMWGAIAEVALGNAPKPSPVG